MNILLFSLNAIMPLILIVVIGIILRRIKLIDDHFINMAYSLCFKVAFPFLLLKNIYDINFYQNFNIKLILFLCISTSIVIISLLIFAPLFIKERGKCGAFIQGVFRGNVLLLGLPLAANLFGEEGTSLVSMLLPILVPIYSFIAVIILSIFSDDTKNNDFNDKINYKKMLLNIVKNPLIIASFLGIILSISGIKIPKFVYITLQDIGKIATPLALILLGAQFKISSLKGRLKLAIIATALRSIIIPAIGVFIAISMNFRGPVLGVIFIVLSTPITISSYIMAKIMNNDSELTGQIILLTTILSGLILFLGIIILKSLCLI